MGALGHYMELAGIATTQISLIREHTEAINPPRALWVSFMLGRPFGIPNEPAFQTRVLRAVLKLLEAPAGPVLADYPEDAPADAAGAPDQVCPVSFARQVDENNLGEVFLREVSELAPWHDLARERRQRTTVGLTGLPVTQSAGMLKAFLEGNLPSLEGYAPAQALKLAMEDVRAYYQEAAAARPGSPDADAVQQWFWQDTAAGRVFLAVHQACAASPEKAIKALSATSVVPRAVLVGLPK